MENITSQADTKLLTALETKINELAPQWRGAQRRGETQRAESVVRQYQVVLRCMLELGYTLPLDVDAELPDELMPQEYLALHGRL